MIKERPILFSAPMVKAVRDNFKTQTRRASGLDRFNVDPDAWRLRSVESCGTKSNPFVALTRKKGAVSAVVFDGDGGEMGIAACPFGKPGDRLWVRENFRYFLTNVEEGVQFKDGNLYNVEDMPLTSDDAEQWGQWLRITAPTLGVDVDQYKGKWRPSIHMPRFASRISLEIVDIRVERLNAISDSDVWAEGVRGFGGKKKGYIFANLWESINGKGSWDLNPWVWAVEFKFVDAGVAL